MAKDRGRMFSIRVGVDGHFRGEFEKHGLKFIYEGQVRGNHVEMTVECEVDKKIGGKPVKKKFTLLKANIRIG